MSRKPAATKKLKPVDLAGSVQQAFDSTRVERPRGPVFPQGVTLSRNLDGQTELVLDPTKESRDSLARILFEQQPGTFRDWIEALHFVREEFDLHTLRDVPRDALGPLAKHLYQRQVDRIADRFREAGVRSDV